MPLMAAAVDKRVLQEATVFEGDRCMGAVIAVPRFKFRADHLLMCRFAHCNCEVFSPTLIIRAQLIFAIGSSESLTSGFAAVRESFHRVMRYFRRFVFLVCIFLWAWNELRPYPCVFGVEMTQLSITHPGAAAQPE